ncbi:MAG: hypothetical protein HYX68_09520 [Planctomycetes bacterium]|nr:hypothetical protein [Planctomycetota bacterium]
MIRAAPLGLCVLLALAGCKSEKDFIQLARDQRAAWNETADILATIKDEKSMARAKEAFAAKLKDFEAISQRAQALGPPPEGAVARLRDEEFLIRDAFSRLTMEAERVSKLPGGEEFLKQYRSRSQNLFKAVKP